MDTTDGATRRYDPNTVYTVKSKPKGYVLLINIETFENGFRQRRYGSDKDYTMLKGMWENFGYNVIEHYNLNKKEFECAVSEFTAMPEHENVDSAITFIMSHGKEDKDNPHGVLITTADDKFVSSDWIRDRFSSTNCKALIGKPKILFFQACRGNLRDNGVSCDFMELRNFNAPVGRRCVPVISDLLIVYPTLPGYVSQRHILFGAWFVQQLIGVFTRDSPHTDLLTMLNKVDNRIRELSKSTGCSFQVIYFESWGFNKKIYFQPKKLGIKKKGRRKTITRRYIRECPFFFVCPSCRSAK